MAALNRLERRASEAIDGRMKDWIFVTSSSDKASEAERILGRTLVQKRLDLPEIQSLDLEEVITQKAQLAYETLNRVPVIVEDTGLFIKAWNGLPGPLIRWFEASVGLEGICTMLSGFSDRTATAKTLVAAHDGSLRIFSGEVDGNIAGSPSEKSGFGWDRIFIPAGETRTFAEMSPHEKDAISMRRRAFERLAESLWRNTDR